MKSTTSTPNMTSPPAGAAANLAPHWPRNFEEARKRAGEYYAARDGMGRMTLNDWLEAEQELKQEFAEQTDNTNNHERSYENHQL